MSVEGIMKEHGFAAGSTGGGCEWYTKEIKHDDRDAFIAITDDGGLSLPESLDAPVYVGIYDLETEEVIVEVKRFESLKAVLASLE